MTTPDTQHADDGLSAAFEQKAAVQKTASQALLAAIEAEDTTAFAAALKNAVKEEVDLNQNKGAFLHNAAHKKNFLMMKDLVLAGADIRYAYAEAYKVHEAKEKGSRGKWYGIFDVLSDYMGVFTEYESKIQAVRQQEQMLRELHDIKIALAELANPAALQKVSLPAPAGKKEM